MLRRLIHLYTTAMRNDVRSPVPHLAGPPGVGKSETVAQLAELQGVRLHTINVSRISPLELEGVQMPTGTAEELHLKLLHNPLWTQLQEGDIVLLDEFLRGFPEVYNGLLDILTSREVAGFKLPRVFFIAASNNIVTYDAALEDRLLHLFVPDPRGTSGSATRLHLKRRFLEDTGLLPELRDSSDLEDVFTSYVDPMYELLDQFKNPSKRAGNSSLEGKSLRHLAGAVKLRQCPYPELQALIKYNNQVVENNGKYQHYVYLPGRSKPGDRLLTGLRDVAASPRATPEQRAAAQLNIDLIDMYSVALD